MTKASKGDVVHRIRHAFADVEHPRVERIAALKNDDIHDFLQSCASRKWSDLSTREIFENRAAIWSLSPEGFRYYLPAFLIAALSGDPHGEAGDIRDTVMAALDPREGSHEKESSFQRRISLLTPKERDGTRAFIEAIREADGSWKHDPAADPFGFWLSGTER